MPENWTTKIIPDLTGKFIIVTSANSSIGHYAAKDFTHKGAQNSWFSDRKREQQWTDHSQGIGQFLVDDRPAEPAETYHKRQFTRSSAINATSAVLRATLVPALPIAIPTVAPGHLSAFAGQHDQLLDVQIQERFQIILHAGTGGVMTGDMRCGEEQAGVKVESAVVWQSPKKKGDEASPLV